MTEREDLPAVKAAQGVVVPTAQCGSLVGRGLVAFLESKKRELTRNSQGERYRQARVAFDRRGRTYGWDATDNPAISSALKSLQQLADENYGKAYYPLFILYRQSQDIEENQPRAYHYFQMAFDWCIANQANQDAELWCDLGEMYQIGRGVEEDDDAQAAKWYRQAAEQSYAPAQFSLGYMYANGKGVPQDYQEAVKWFRLAAEQGVALAQANLGVMYRDGLGVPQDHIEAVRWYRRAVDQDDAGAQHKLGYMYDKGLGVLQDHQEAANWYRLAADRGDALGQFSLGTMYSNGRGVPQDHQEAAKWYRLAAEQGDASAQANLGYMYANGKGVPQDHQVAVKWFRLAAEQGDAYAQDSLRKLGVDWK